MSSVAVERDMRASGPLTKSREVSSSVSVAPAGAVPAPVHTPAPASAAPSAVALSARYEPKLVTVVYCSSTRGRQHALSSRCCWNSPVPIGRHGNSSTRNVACASAVTGGSTCER